MAVAATAEARVHRLGRLERPQRDAPALFDARVTLEDVVLHAWEALCAEGSATCLVCGGSTRPIVGCESCGSVLT